MSRAIDADALYQTEKLLDTNIVRRDKVASELLEQVLYDIRHFPTLAPQNELLTIEQLREMDGEPVWVVYSHDEAKTTPEFDYLTLWALVDVGKYAVRLTNKFGGRTAYSTDQELDWAGITVYRRPPEKQEDDHGE